MKIVVTIILATLCIYVCYEYIRIGGLVSKTNVLIAQAVPYQSNTGLYSMLVLGDSTAVGVGATSPETSLPALLGNYIHASVENHAVSGAVTVNMEGQLHQAQRSHYDAILIQVGANDVVGLGSIAAANDQLETLLADAQQYSRNIILVTAGRIGDAPIFPVLIKPYLNSRAAEMRTIFGASAASAGAIYIDLSGSTSDAFDKNPAKYYAADMFHPSTAGYALWFAAVKALVNPQLLGYGG